MAIAVVAAALVLVPSSPAWAQTPPNDTRRGVVHDGLVRTAPDGVCRGTFALARDASDRHGRSRCTHGPDPAPDGVDVRRARPVAELQAAAPAPASASAEEGRRGAPNASVAAAAGTIPCYGNGTDGYRVQVIYARASNVADRYLQLAGSFVQWSAAADEVARASAADTGGTRHFRFVTDAICSLDVDRVTLSTTGDDNFDNTVAELVAKGYNRPDRKYLVYVDANVYCGIGEIYYDDTANATPGANANNGHAQVAGMIARVDNGCWGQASSVEAHELMHNLGGVQPSAPHATPGLHCTDENDRMCYADGSGGGLMQLICALLGGENRFDCNHDDYFSTDPPAGSYLATHWNTANSVFLATAEPVPGKGKSWGFNGYGGLGDGKVVDGPSAVDMLVTGLDSASAGGYHSLAAKAGTVWSWGLSNLGQLGLGPAVFHTTIPTQVPGLTGVAAVSAGYAHSLVMKSDGTVWAWGWNGYGQLGDGTSVDKYQPVQVQGLSGVVAIAAGGAHSLALLADGSIRAWGWGGVGQLGTGAPTSSLVPVPVSGADTYTSVAAGFYHSMAVRANGSVAAWGWNSYGQVGDGTTTDRVLPTTVAGLTGMRAVSAGLAHSLALGTDGIVRSWGLGHLGQLGRPGVWSPTAAAVPGLTGVTAIGAGGYHSVALLAGGTVSSWGWNASGQMGDGTRIDRAVPVGATRVTGVKGISAGLAHTLAVQH